MSRITINSNIASLGAQRRLGQHTDSLRLSFERLSSGLRVNRAVDDAAGLAIGAGLNVDGRVLGQGVRNLNDGLSLLNIADGALSELSSVVTRIRELSTQASNGTLSNKQRAALDTEAQQLSQEFTRIVQSTEFNGRNLFGAGFGSLRVQAGYADAGGIVDDLGGAVGTGTYLTAVSYAAQETVSVGDIATGDLNGDGILDLVTGGTRSVAVGTATVRLGIGDGTFAAGVSYVMETSGSTAIALGDVNGDGVLDMVSAGASASNGTATVRFGNGNGTFRAPTSYVSETGQSEDIALADLNGDGAIDLVTAGNASGGFNGYTTVRLNSGSGTFGAARSYATSDVDTRAVTVADVNADGILDLVTGGQSGASLGEAHYLLGTGSGTFSSAVTLGVGGQALRDVTIADINADGLQDLITTGDAGASAGFVGIQFGTGGGTFKNPITFAMASTTSNNLQVTDVNGDGILDLAATGDNAGVGALSVRLGNGNGTFVAARTFLNTIGSGNGLVANDFNGDGVIDFATGGGTSAAIQLASTVAGVSALLPFSLRTRADALQSMSIANNALTKISSQRASIGAFQSRLGTASNNLLIARENYQTAESAIMDVDIAEESAKLVRGRILQQAGTAILAQANSTPELALILLGR